MATDRQAVRASIRMPSTSGRSCCHFDLEDAQSTMLRLQYAWSTYAPESDEPTEHEVVVPPMNVVRDRLLAFAEQVRPYANALGRKGQPPSAVTTELAANQGHSFRLELRPTDPGLITSPWQAVFVFFVATGPSFRVEARFVVDATCLDLFSEGLDAVLNTDHQHMAGTR